MLENINFLIKDYYPRRKKLPQNQYRYIIGNRERAITSISTVTTNHS